MITPAPNHFFLLHGKSQGRGPLMQIVHVPPLILLVGNKKSTEAASSSHPGNSKGNLHTSAQGKHDRMLWGSKIQVLLFRADCALERWISPIILRGTSPESHWCSWAHHPRDDKLLPFNCLTLMAQTHLSYQQETQGSSWCAAALCWELDISYLPWSKTFQVICSWAVANT